LSRNFLSGKYRSPFVFLDIRYTVFYGQFMEKIVSLLFSAMLVFAGFGSVPRCYVTRPYCVAHGTFQCPLAHPECVTTQNGCTGCPHIAHNSSRQQKIPADRLARFSIDQDRPGPDLSRDCVPTVALVQNLQLSLADPLHDKGTFTARLTHLPEPPLLILLQKQSFLI
jgi:hypothetical protein